MDSGQTVRDGVAMFLVNNVLHSHCNILTHGDDVGVQGSAFPLI